MPEKVKDPDKKKLEEAKLEEAEKKEKPKRKEELKEKELRVVVRLVGSDLDGEKKTLFAIRSVKGLSYAMAKAVCIAAGIDPYEKLGSLGEDALAKLEAAIKEPAKYGIPTWFLNRRRDMESGRDMHLSGVDVKVTERFDIKAMIDMKSRRGTRHMLGLPVRGQRTRSSFRKGKTVGVVRRKMLAAQKVAGQKKK